MIRQANNVWSQCTPDLIQPLRDFLSYETSYWERTRWGRREVPYRRTFVGKTGWFFSGFLPLVQKEFPEVEISRIPPKTAHTATISQLGDKVLRDYQIVLLRRAMDVRRGVLKAPTGSGKTLVEAAVIKSLPDCVALLIVHTKSLLYQIKNELEDLLKEEIGIVGDGKGDWKGITVGMIQTLSKYDKKELWKLPIRVLIVDEAHHVIGNTYQKVLSAIDAEFRLGFSATPKDFEDPKGEYLKVIGVLGPIIKTVEYEEVKHVLAIPKVEMINYPNNGEYEDLRWREAYRYGIEENPRRNLAVVQTAERLNGSILIMVKTVRHGEILSSSYLSPIFVQGRDNNDTRERIKGLLKKRGQKTVVVSTPVFGEGVDIPALDVLINAGGGKSRIQTIQWAGRALRKTKGKEEGIIVDFWDEGNRYLIEHSYQRYNVYEKLGWVKKIGG